MSNSEFTPPSKLYIFSFNLDKANTIFVRQLTLLYSIEGGVSSSHMLALTFQGTFQIIKNQEETS